jgi:NAD(P)H-quinone oxidoreductase subunit 5
MILAVLVLPLLSALVYWFPSNNFQGLKRLSLTGLLICLVCLLWCLGHPQLTVAPLRWVLLHQADLRINLAWHIDALALSMMLVVLLIGLLVIGYSSRYLLSDPHQRRFMFWLTLIIFSVFTLLCSANLLTAFIGWQWIGFNLYWLLNHYHFDPEANRSAKKKFILNRLGDVSFLTAVALCLAHMGSTEFSDLLRLRGAQGGDGLLSWVLGLLIISVMTKSAQFPFHFWLPDTLQTPTPVSAIMHAGVINAGGFLLARLSPVLVTEPYLMQYLVMVGVLTMGAAWLCGMTQASIKKQLAYSTMGQMGFMLMQAGLGSFVGALFHLIMHGFYKVWAFLRSGETLERHPKNQQVSLMAWSVSGCLGLVFLGSMCWLFPWTSGLVMPYALIGFFMWVTLTQCLRVLCFNSGSFVARMTAIGILWLLTMAYGAGISYFHHELDGFVSQDWVSFSVFDQSMILAAILILAGWIWRSKHRRILLPISVNQAYVETAARRFILQPFRACGDVLLAHPRIMLFMQLALVALVVLVVMGHLGHLATLAASLMLIFFTAANRAPRLRARCLYLLLGQVSLALLTLSLPSSRLPGLAIFQMVNLVFIAALFLLLFTKVQQRGVNIDVKKNQFPAAASYLTIGLFCLIGLPGTSTFITELLVFRELVHAPLYLLLMVMLAFVLLAIAILHALQDFVFNAVAVERFAVKLSWFEHFILVLMLAYNIISGFLPLYFLF